MSDQQSTTGQSVNRSLKMFLDEVADLPGFTPPLTDVNSRSITGDTPLHVAAVHGDVEIVRLLLQAGAKVDVQGEHGYTPLHEAIAQKHKGVAEVLLQAGASVDLPNSDGVTPRKMMQRSGW
jgi:ankyrin repeat protein